MAHSDSVRNGDGAVMAVLFPRASAWPGFQSCPDRQTERRFRYRRGDDFSWRKDIGSHRDRGCDGTWRGAANGCQLKEAAHGILTMA